MLKGKIDTSYIIKKQLISSVTSVAANYRAVCRARSDAEFYSKLCIVVEESDESVFWLELIKESEILNANQDELIYLFLNKMGKHHTNHVLVYFDKINED